MSNKNKEGFFANLKHDLPASLVVFLVAMPLCLGIALASDAPPFSGIIAGIVGGTIVALISGSSLGVSGPAAGLAVIVASAIGELGFHTFLLAVIFAGILQILFGILKAGVVGYYFPSAVIKGMLAGIGILIALKQIPHALGDDADPEGDFQFMQVDGQNTFTELIQAFDSFHLGAIVIAAFSLLVLIIWEQPFMKKLSFTNIIQGPLVVVASGIGFNFLFQGSEELGLRSDMLVNIPLSNSVISFLGHFEFPNWSELDNPRVYAIGFIMALVASLETLLCVEATDKLDPEKRITPTNRELFAQGTGNILSGLIGGLPVTQVIVRSSANIQSGGKSKASAFFHGILLIGTAFAIPDILNMIPTASLAGILLVVGYKLAKPSQFMAMYKQGLVQFLPFIITILGIVFTDLLIGISLGVAVAVVQLLWNNYKTPYHFDASKVESGKPIVIELSEDVSFLNKAGIMHTLDLIPHDSELVIDAHKTQTIHADVIEIIEEFEVTAKRRNIKLKLVGFERLGHINQLEKLQESMDKRTENDK
ncbi:MAG: MFS superfamily sulfate permease-like transporter [Flavobacteriales bacterium]|jgi:MFS superfamily sulfate permease-like transporter